MQETNLTKKPGKIIVLEGVDGSGKSTQARNLYHNFSKKLSTTLSLSNQQRVYLFHFPSNENSGQLFTDYIRDLPKDTFDGYQATWILLNDMMYQMYTTILPLYWSGAIIILDRYYTSSMYCQIHRFLSEKDKIIPDQITSLSFDQIEYLDWIEDMADRVLRLPRPDLVIYLNAQLSTVISNLHYTDKVKDGYENSHEFLHNCVIYGDHIATMKKWKKIQCDFPMMSELRSEESICEEICDIVEAFLLYGKVEN